MTERRTCRSLAETAAWAAELGQRLRPGTCVGLVGELGAGKTTFVRYLVRALGGNERRVSSPTFVLLHVYEDARPVVYHLDAYRLHGASELLDIGFADLLEQRGVVIVEWADRVPEALPAAMVKLEIEARSPRTRRFVLHDESHLLAPPGMR